MSAVCCSDSINHAVSAVHLGFAFAALGRMLAVPQTRSIVKSWQISCMNQPIAFAKCGRLTPHDCSNVTGEVATKDLRRMESADVPP